MQLIYYALLLTIGTIAIAIIVYTLVMLGGCGSLPRDWAWMSVPRPAASSMREDSLARLNLSPYSASSFRYRAEEQSMGLEGGEVECVVCLLGFKEYEEVRQLHGCKHSFHASCIDMWMYTHSNCPICRTPVDRRAAPDFTSSMEVSREIITSPLDRV